MSSRTVSKDFQVLGNRETVKTNKGPVTSRFKLSWQSNELPDKGIRGPVSLGRVNDERKLGRLFFLFFIFFFVSIGSEEMDLGQKRWIEEMILARDNSWKGGKERKFQKLNVPRENSFEYTQWNCLFESLMFLLVDFYVVRLYHWIITCTIEEREEEDRK